MVLVGKKANLTTAAGYCLYLDTTGVVNGIIADGSASTEVSSTPITDGEEFVVTLVRSVATDSLLMYLNGRLCVSATDGTSNTLANAVVLSIGRLSAAASNELDGEIFNINLFRQALSSEEVQELYSSYTGLGATDTLVRKFLVDDAWCTNVRVGPPRIRSRDIVRA